MRTVLNIKSGGSTRLSGIIHSLFLLCVIFFFAPLASKIPLAVLAGILLKVGFDIIDYKFLKLLKIAPRGDLAVMLLVFLITVLDDLILAVGVGIVLSSILFALNVARQTDVDVKTLTGDDDCDVACIEEDAKNRIMTMRIKGTFFFGSASQVLSRVEGVLDTNHVIIDCHSLKIFDISAVFALEDMILRIKDSGAKVSLVLNNEELAEQLLKLGLTKFLSKDNIFFEPEKAIEKAKT